MGGGSLNFFSICVFFPFVFVCFFLGPSFYSNLCPFPARQSCCSLASLLLLKGQRDDAFGGAFTHALVRSSSASDFGFRRREEEGGIIESETYRLQGERQILSSASFELRMLGLFSGDQDIDCVFLLVEFASFRSTTRLLRSC